jgi:hypothetical protein
MEALRLLETPVSQLEVDFRGVVFPSAPLQYPRFFFHFHTFLATNPQMTRYATVETSAKSAKSCGSYLRVHFKNTREVAAVIAGIPV